MILASDAFPNLVAAVWADFAEEVAEAVRFFMGNEPRGAVFGPARRRFDGLGGAIGMRRNDF